MKKNDIEKVLPDFAKAVKSGKGEKIVFHHVAFSSDEYELLGAAIKYATSNGVNVEIISDSYPDKMLLNDLENSLEILKKDGTRKEQAILITKN